MKEKILIVEDQFVEADYLKILLEKEDYYVTGIARSVTQANELIQKERPGFVLIDIFLKGKQTGIDLAKKLQEDNIPFVYLSANSNEAVLNEAKETQPYGFLVKPFREKDLMVTLEIARYRHQQELNSKLHRQKVLQKKLTSIAAEKETWNNKLLRTVQALQQYLQFDCMVIKFKELKNTNFSAFGFLRIGYDEYQTIGISELSNITGLPELEIKNMLGNTPVDETAGCYNGAEFESLFPLHPMKRLFAKTFNFCSNLVIPFTSRDGYNFSLVFFSRITEGYQIEQLDWFFRLQEPLTSIINSIPTVEKKQAVSMQNETKTMKGQQVPRDAGFDGIIGKSPALLAVMDMVNRICQMDTSILLLGESGTGKERIADCIHSLSSRKGKPFIKLNCAALPATLIESELFGHEKGAFTSATDRRIGKFEQANGGTIFLDEIGEMPIELQVKLLRVLQEKEIERLGGKDTIKVDVRIITATNRNLEKEVAEGRFRLDLYYRLNVFPITLPALRNRKEDIPALSYHFMNYYNQKAGKKISGISEDVQKHLMDYDWPGNIRELEHLIERSVLLAKGSVIDEVFLPSIQKKEVGHTVENRMKTIHENERDYIISVLKKCNGRIWGAGAAAEILNIPPSTLQSKMKKLGIKKEFIQ